jgi:hypothetical protein
MGTHRGNEKVEKMVRFGSSYESQKLETAIRKSAYPISRIT